jgi:RNA polymerase sigma-70 factor (family 1)
LRSGENHIALNVLSDEALCELLAGDDAAAFAELYDRYFQKIYSTSVSFLKLTHLAKDATQEIFLRIWDNRDKLAGADNAAAYIHRIVRNHILNILKKNLKEIPSALESFEETSEDSELSAERKLAIKNFKAKLEKAIEDLPTQQRLVFRLSREADLSYKDIGEKIGISPNTVRIHLVKAVAQLRAQFSERDTELMILLIVFGLVPAFQT